MGSFDALSAVRHAEMALRECWRQLTREGEPASIIGRKLPGGWGYETHVPSFLEVGRCEGVEERFLSAAARRFGSRVRYFSAADGAFRVVGGVCLMGELVMALCVEQACGVQDIIRRRLQLSPATTRDAAALRALIESANQLDSGMDVGREFSEVVE